MDHNTQTTLIKLQNDIVLSLQGYVMCVPDVYYTVFKLSGRSRQEIADLLWPIAMSEEEWSEPEPCYCEVLVIAVAVVVDVRNTSCNRF